ncbi:MAG: outer membrane lipoprotein-sorting protein [Proteobacteria bacterium]|nr:outer membrane lipoprotein-sorting protein [Pseudomonadota bacterium]
MKINATTFTWNVMFATLGTIICLTPLASFAQSAVEIMEKNFVITKVTDSESESTFILRNKSGIERVRKTFGTTKLRKNGIDNMRMTRFIKPNDVRGMVSLLIEQSETDDDIWLYLPSMKKIRRLVSSNKKDSFVGTDFSYGDVIGHKVQDWDHAIMGEELIDGFKCYVIESTPKNKTTAKNTGYSKRVSWIQKEAYVTRKAEMYNLSGALYKQMSFKNLQLVDSEQNRWVARELRATDVISGHSTIIKVDKLKVNVGVKDTYFTTRYMENE